MTPDPTIPRPFRRRTNPRTHEPSALTCCIAVGAVVRSFADGVQVGPAEEHLDRALPQQVRRARAQARAGPARGRFRAAQLEELEARGGERCGEC